MSVPIIWLKKRANGLINRGEFKFIPVGAKHRLSNYSKEILNIIEVQSGSYLGEDDIERFEDNYGRLNS